MCVTKATYFINKGKNKHDYIRTYFAVSISYEDKTKGLGVVEFMRYRS